MSIHSLRSQLGPRIRPYQVLETAFSSSRPWARFITNKSPKKVDLPEKAELFPRLRDVQQYFRSKPCLLVSNCHHLLSSILLWPLRSPACSLPFWSRLKAVAVTFFSYLNIEIVGQKKHSVEIQQFSLLPNLTWNNGKTRVWSPSTNNFVKSIRTDLKVKNLISRNFCEKSWWE